MWLLLEGDAQTHAEPVADGHFCRYFPSSLATATNPIRIAYVSGRTIGVSGVRKYRKKPERQGPPETKYWLFSDRRCLMRLGARWCPTSQLRLPIQNDPAYQISPECGSVVRGTQLMSQQRVYPPNENSDPDFPWLWRTQHPLLYHEEHLWGRNETPSLEPHLDGSSLYR